MGETTFQDGVVELEVQGFESHGIDVEGGAVRVRRRSVTALAPE